MEKIDVYKLFSESKNYSRKHKKYFNVYDNIFSHYKDKKITFVEVGLLDGGSLLIWRKYFGPNARIIGIDINKDCKKFEEDGFEIFIGSQSDPLFWDSFFKEVGNVDIILDDGGHTNEQQIITTLKCIPYIKDDGIHVVEDTHTSYQKNFGNPSKYSFINFTKKTIDDLNFTFPNLNRFKYSLNKFIYSIQYYESFVIFKVNRSLCVTNEIIENSGKKMGHLDLRDGKNWNNFRKKFSFLLKQPILKKFERILVRLRNLIINKRLAKYFK